MKIAILSDVHANLPALQAVIVDARSRQVNEFWNLGDMVGFSPFPNETIALLQQTCAQHIVGNYDLKVLSAERIAKMRKTQKDADKLFSFEWTHQHLSPESVSFIKSLAETERVKVKGQRVLLTHGSPEGIEDGLADTTPLARFEALALNSKADIILCGHTHRFFQKKVAGVFFVNPGSVGRPFDGDTRASYAILEITDQGVTAELFRVSYDVQGLAAEMKALQFPARLIRMLAEAKSLDDLAGQALAGPDEVLRSALQLAKECRYEKEHAQQVTRLALRIFDETRDLHGLGLGERFLVQAAGLLHDIGLVYGVDGHHKASRDLILKANQVPFADRDRVIVALITRYHRRSMPESKHRYYEDLSKEDQRIVDVLAAILRVADGLDRTHKSVIKDLNVEVGADRIEIKASSSAPAEAEMVFARTKGDLLEKVFARSLRVRMSSL
ncbi:MAG: YfcE family phosphodiesterase [Candidatus Omnitrophica bacterium]|nr:YfcE family phosphodiesterase [Candidatus Omnitrophota bacterium]